MKPGFSLETAIKRAIEYFEFDKDCYGLEKAEVRAIYIKESNKTDGWYTFVLIQIDYADYSVGGNYCRSSKYPFVICVEKSTDEIPETYKGEEFPCHIFRY